MVKKKKRSRITNSSSKRTKLEAYERMCKEFEQLLVADKDDLDEHIRLFPDLYHKVSSAAALAEALCAESREEVKRVEAEIGDKVYKKLVKNGEKFTNETLRRKIISRSEWKEAHSRNLEDNYVYSRWIALKSALEKKSYGMHDLVQLYVAQYYTSSDSIRPKALRKRNR